MINAKARIILALSAGLCIGGGIGYVLGERKARAQAEKEIAAIRDMYKRLRTEDAEQAQSDWQSDTDPELEAADSDETTVESLVQTAVDLGYVTPDEAGENRRIDPNYLLPTEQDPEDLGEEDEYVHNIRFVNPHSDNDPDDVTKWDRSPHTPYVITEEEFRIDRPEFEKISLIYYKGDDTLTEQNGSYIPDKNGTAGDENLRHYFGLASGDEYLLHIRNERVAADFEITLDEGSFSRDVLGFEIEDQMVKESKKNIKKMRSHE